MSDPAAYVRALNQEIAELDTYIIETFPELAPHLDDLEQSLHEKTLDLPPATLSKLLWASGMRNGLLRSIYLLKHPDRHPQETSSDENASETTPQPF